MKNQFYRIFSVCFFLLLLSYARLFALDGAIGSHDPANIIKEGNRYWMFTTGAGIYAAYSDDMFSWHSAPKTVFPVGTWPEWINQAVPGFEGFFWAPEVIYMNGKYYMYYSCSTFGSPKSAIGVATSPTLDQNSPAYHWTDLGMVVSSSVQTDINAIDPAILKDDDGRVYMSYGSFSGGIGVLELDPETGLRKEGAAIKHVAGGNRASWEAPYIFKEGGYYYLIVNRGFCCRDVNSTYFMVMGRSTNINGPYLDKAGIDLRSGGGTRILSTSGRHIGPGHFGLMRENGINYVSMHYYDKEDNGYPKLDIAQLGFGADGWPYITRDWLQAGRYKITNQNSGLIWDALGGTGAPGESIAQSADLNQLYQQWDITPLGDGIYKIINAQSGMAADVAFCNPENGTKLWLWYYLDNNCQKFKVDRTADGAFVFTSLTGRRIIEVPAASTAPGTELVIWDHTASLCQRWYINDVAAPVAKATNPSPANAATGIQTPNLSLQWTSDASKFNLLTGTSLNNLRIKASDLTQPAYNLTDTLPLGTYYWRVDANVNGVSSAGTIWSFTVTDTIAPTVLAKNVSVTLDSTGHVSLTAADIDNGSNDAYGIDSIELNKLQFNCSDIGENEVILKVTDKNGNSATASAVVTVIGAKPVPSIAVSRTDKTYTGVTSNTVVLGYGAQELTLTASNSTSDPDKTRYTWSPANGLSNTAISNPVFTPTEAGKYTFTVTATNEYGCTADTSITLTVIDARCGASLNKVLLCHRGKDICIAGIDVKDHLAHGCKLGSCDSNILAGDGSDRKNDNNLQNTSIVAYPNPLSNRTTAKLSIVEAGAFSLELYNMQGVLLKVITTGYSEGNTMLDYELDASGYKQGTYMLLLRTEKSLVTNRIIVQK